MALVVVLFVLLIIVGTSCYKQLLNCTSEMSLFERAEDRLE